jgi:hypothetical protein
MSSVMTKNENELMTELVKMHQENPNDMELGGKVRQMVWQHIQDNSPAY